MMSEIKMAFSEHERPNSRLWSDARRFASRRFGSDVWSVGQTDFRSGSDRIRVLRRRRPLEEGRLSTPTEIGRIDEETTTAAAAATADGFKQSEEGRTDGALHSTHIGKGMSRKNIFKISC